MPYPKGQSVIERFEEIVERYPDRVALEFGDDSMTYAELNIWANSIGRKLREFDIRENDVVGIISKRSFAMIAGILGNIKIRSRVFAY